MEIKEFTQTISNNEEFIPIANDMHDPLILVVMSTDMVFEI